MLSLGLVTLFLRRSFGFDAARRSWRSAFAHGEPTSLLKAITRFDRHHQHHPLFFGILSLPRRCITHLLYPLYLDASRISCPFYSSNGLTSPVTSPDFPCPFPHWLQKKHSCFWYQGWMSIRGIRHIFFNLNFYNFILKWCATHSGRETFGQGIRHILGI